MEGEQRSDKMFGGKFARTRTIQARASSDFDRCSRCGAFTWTRRHQDSCGPTKVDTSFRVIDADACEILSYIAWNVRENWSVIFQALEELDPDLARQLDHAMDVLDYVDEGFPLDRAEAVTGLTEIVKDLRAGA